VKKASTRFFEKKRGKKLLLLGARGLASARHGRESGHPRLRAGPKGVDARFRGHDGFESDGGKLTKVFCGAFLQKSDRFCLDFP